MPKEFPEAAPEWKIVSTGAEGFAMMLDACKKAAKSIECEQFIFAEDAIGLQFLELFLKKAAEGVKIRLLCDQVGSFGLYSSEWPQKLRDAGIEVRFFRTISPWRIGNFTGWYLRTHRKVLVIDSKLAVSGSLSVWEEMHSWRDTTFSITSKPVEQFRYTFETMWDSADDEFFFRFKRFKEYSSGFRVSTNAPHYRQKHIYKNLIGSMQNARESISLATPYFTPNHRFVKAMRDAARRGVAVKLIVPEKTDSKWVNRAARSYFGRLLKSGVRIFRYQSTVLHAKTATIDSAWASVGSFNLDGQSFFWNYETNLESIDRRFIQEIEDQFEKDLLNSKEVFLDEWLARPLYQKFMELLTMPFHRFM